MTENKDIYIHPTIKEITKKLLGVLSDSNEAISLCWAPKLRSEESLNVPPLQHGYCGYQSQTKWNMSHLNCPRCWDCPCPCKGHYND